MKVILFLLICVQQDGQAQCRIAQYATANSPETCYQAVEMIHEHTTYAAFCGSDETAKRIKAFQDDRHSASQRSTH